MRRKLLMECEDHTLQRLPTGLFYAKGVKANFLFFDQWPGAEATWMRTLWMYVVRTNKHFNLKPRRMSRTNLDEYLANYRSGDRPRSHLVGTHTGGPLAAVHLRGDPRPRRGEPQPLFWLRDERLEVSA